jgi:acetylornithine deacetylase/succinyl-diaminopimelate desuccinylase-like protein
VSDKLDACLLKHKGSLTRLLQDLVRIPTVNPPGRNYLGFVARMQRRLALLGLTTQVVRVPQLRMSIGRLLAVEPCFVYPAGDLPGAFAAAVKAVRRRRPNFGVTRGFTDMHYFAKDAGIATIGYGPGGIDAHAIDERVRIADLLQCARVYARFLADWAGQ